LHVVTHGDGPSLVFVHGSAADYGTWTIQLASLRSRFRVVAYDRRGAERSPLPEGVPFFSTAEHAEDTARVIAAHASAPVVAVGSSYGAVIALELARMRPELLAGAVLCEPPLPSSEYAGSAPYEFGCHFDRLVFERGGEVAGELFLRTVLGDDMFERIPDAWRARACGMWRQIRADCASLNRTLPRYASLADVGVPTLLLGGTESPDYFELTLRALHRALPDARLDTVPDAGHSMHADAHRAFNARVVGFCEEIGFAASTP
jgi:pimeloyl-ACP methyl ester carboxylesterase